VRLTVRSRLVTDVEVDEGLPVSRLRAWLARLTGDPVWATATLTADGVPLHEAHPAGRPPLVHGATLRPEPGPVPDEVAAARAALHIGVVAGPDTGALLIPFAPGTEGAGGGSTAPHMTARRSRGPADPLTLGPGADLAVVDPDGWLVSVRPPRRSPLGVLRSLPGRHERGAPATDRDQELAFAGGRGRRGALVRASSGRTVVVRAGRRSRAVRRVPRWRWVRWRVDDELRAGASVLVLRAGAGPAPGTGAGGLAPRAGAGRGREIAAGRAPRRGRRRAARYVPALAGAAVSVALAVTLRQPVLALGALSALLLVGQRPDPPGPAADLTAQDEPTDLPALRVALARGGAPPAALVPPWDGDLAVTGPRDAALAAARGLLLGALLAHGGRTVALRTDRPADWAWLTRWAPTVPPDPDAASAHVVAGATTSADAAGCLVVLDGRAAQEDLHPGAAVIRLPAGAAPSWCRAVLEVDGRAARLRDDAGWRTVPYTGVTGAVADAVARVAGRLPTQGPGPGAEPGLPLGRCPADVALGSLPGMPGVDPEAIRRVWQRAAPGPSLAIPLGAGPDGVPVVVDLVADGPHALVAGTTGSGKSELLTTLVVALAAVHPPDRLAVLLVDFKGGTGLPAVAGLPHVVGHLSDLDATGARRTLRGLAAELRRRERILAARGASDVRDLDPAVAPPRLLVVADEFRVLADELPDLLPSLARLAAQGRSLGVHLVLATQRPAGAVPTDLRANVALRVVLRVADPAESADLVGVPDAARIDRPGLAVLARGARRPEPVQVALASVRRSAPVRLAGAAHTWAAGGARPPDEDGAATWVAAITAAAAGRPRAEQPWLPPLPDVVRIEDVPAGPGLPLALADLPDELARGPVRWDADAGHLLVVGGPGSGRSTALAAVAAAALAEGRAVHAVGLPPALRPPGLASALDTDDVTRVARLVRLLAGAASGPGPRPLLVLDDVAGALAELSALARGAPAERLEQLWAAAGGPVGVAAGGALGPATTRLALGFADRLVLGSPDPSADLLAGVPVHLAGPRRRPGRAVHLGRDGAVLCQVALPNPGAPVLGGGGSAEQGRSAPAGGGATVRPGGVHVAPLPVLAGRPTGLAAVAVGGVALGIGGDGAGVVRVGTGASLLVVGPPGSGRTVALDAVAAASAGAGGLVVRVTNGLTAPEPEAVLVVDDLDDAEARDPLLSDALAKHVAGGGRLLAATTTAHAVSAFRGSVPALVRGRRLLVLDPAEPGSLDLLGPDGAWLVDPRRRQPGRAVLREGRDLTPLQLFTPAS